MFVPNCYAYSSGFLYMINAMNIEMNNSNGLPINEEIYERYNLIVYGNPITANDPKQRWKSTENGNWTKGGGAWNGAGERGEYWILGQDFSGRSVHNEIFPDDYNSGTSPLEWNYRVITGAEESWSDASKYMYDEQKEYMLSQKLSRFGVTYDLTVADIGLDKVRLENYATWGSAGSVYTEKPGQGNVYWVATFSIPPMAGDARLNSILKLPNGTEYTISKDENEIEIPLSFGACIDGLSEYAKAEHIKVIESELKVNGVTSNAVSASETIRISKNGNLIIKKSDYPGAGKITLNLECNSFASTYFPSDPVMYSNKNVVVTINFESESKNRVPDKRDPESPVIYDITVKRVTTDKWGNEFLEDLYVNKKTGTPFVCAGQVIRIEVEVSKSADLVTFDFAGSNSIRTLDSLTKKFLWDEPNSRGEKSEYWSLSMLQRAYNMPGKLLLEETTGSSKIYSATYVIPYKTTQTLHSWNSLREEKKDAFKIDETKLFKRMGSVYSLVIKATSEKGSRTKNYTFDVAERWDELYNHDISMYILEY